MALVVKEDKRFEHPTEPDAWFVVRLPLSAGDMANLHTDGTSVAMSLDLMAQVIKEWSYEPAVSLDSVGDLDLDTFIWLSGQIIKASGIRSAAEKKDLPSDSPGTSEQAGEPSRTSSDI